MYEFVVDDWCMCMCVFIMCSFIYETEHHNGIAELLEILGRYDVYAAYMCVLLMLVQCFFDFGFYFEYFCHCAAF